MRTSLLRLGMREAKKAEAADFFSHQQLLFHTRGARRDHTDGL
jgi:hypothetical protein